MEQEEQQNIVESTDVDAAQVEDTSASVETEEGEVQSAADQAQQVQETYEWGGRQLSPKELYEESRRLQGEYTRKTQELAELRQAQQAPAKSQEEDLVAQLTPEERAQYEAVAKNLSPFMRDIIDKQVQARVQEHVTQTLTQKEQTEQYRRQFSEAEQLAKKIGVNYDQTSLIEYMQKTGNADVLSAFKAWNETAYIDYMAKQRQTAKKPIYSEKGSSTPKKGPAKEYDTRKVNDPAYKKDLGQKLRDMLNGG